MNDIRWHVKIGDQSWCQFPVSPDILVALIDGGRHGGHYYCTCSHPRADSAQRMVEKLHELGIPDARVVGGPCDQRDDLYYSEEPEELL